MINTLKVLKQISIKHTSFGIYTDAVAPTYVFIILLVFPLILKIALSLRRKQCISFQN